MSNSKIRILAVSSLFLFIIAIVGSACYDFIQPQENKSSVSIPSLHDNPQSTSRIAFAIAEGTELNIYAAKFDGSDKQILDSFDIGDLEDRTELFTEINAYISPDRNLIAYQPRTKEFITPYDNETGLSAFGPVFLVDNQGKGKKKIFDSGGFLAWTPDNKKIIYDVPTPILDDQKWHIFDIQTGKDKDISPLNVDLEIPVFWIDSTTIFFVTFFTPDPSPKYYSFNIDTRKVRENNISGLPEGNQLFQNSMNPARTHTILNADYCTGSSCVCGLYELTNNFSVVKLAEIGGDTHHYCGRIDWNGNKEVFWGIVTSSRANKLNPGEKNASSFLVKKYNFETGLEDLVSLITKYGDDPAGFDNDRYRFLGVVEGRGLIFLNERKKDSPKFTLEVRDLDGKNPREVISSEKEILYLGELQ